MSPAELSRRAQRVVVQQRRRRARIALIGALVVVIGVAVLTILLSGDDEPIDDGATRIDVEMFEFGFAGDLTAPAGLVRLEAKNVGQIDHNIGIRSGPISNHIPPGSSTMLTLGTLAPGTYELYCDIVGHPEAGMVAPLIITERASTTAAVP